MFMCERSVLLFNEYINISKTYGNDEINMCDVKQFIINKTAGPLKLSERDNLEEIKNISHLAQIFRNFLYKLFCKVTKSTSFYDNYTYNDFFEFISYILSNVLYKMDNLGFRDTVENELDKLVDTDLEDLPREVNLLKVRLELFLYVYNIKNNTKIAES